MTLGDLFWASLSDSDPAPTVHRFSHGAGLMVVTLCRLSFPEWEKCEADLPDEGRRCVGCEKAWEKQKEAERWHWRMLMD